MTALLESTLLTIPDNLKGAEIDHYIKLQLEGHFPQPERLIYDYIITGRRVLLTYMLKEDYHPGSTILHPHLLIKHRVWKRGNFHIIGENSELLLCLNRGVITQVESDSEAIKDLNLEDITTVVPEDLTPLYKQCRKDMFSKRPGRRALYPIIGVVLISIFTSAILALIHMDKKLTRKEALLEARYSQIVAAEDKYLNEGEKYRFLEEAILTMESHISPSTYRILELLEQCSTDLIIKDLSINSRSLTLTVITPNSLELLKDLNSSRFMNLRLINTVPGDNMELASYSGAIQWP